MNERNPELATLLLLELRRHLATLTTSRPEGDAAKRVLHALKGSAGLAGERELASALERIEKRLKESDPAAVSDAVTLVGGAISELEAGNKPVPEEWPEPPPGLRAAVLDEAIRPHYLAEVVDRLGAIEQLLSGDTDPSRATQVVYRHVHTLKGAASAVGDEPMAWFCRGLEDRLIAVRTVEDAESALREVRRYQTVMSWLARDPERALSSLRTGRSGKAEGVRPLLAATSETADSNDAVSNDALSNDAVSRSPIDVPTVGVAVTTLDRLLDRWEAVGSMNPTLGNRTESYQRHAERLRRIGASLTDALRLMGPPRPRSAPAAALRRVDAATHALARIAEEIEDGSARLQDRERLLNEAALDARTSLSAMRVTTTGRLFERLTRVTEAEAARAGRAVVVRVQHGGEEPLDRRRAEALFDPCLRLVRNAVTHGIETPQERDQRGKPKTATLTMAAQRSQGRLQIVIADDGRGVDARVVKRRAVETGILTEQEAEDVDDGEALALLIRPGFSTPTRSDRLADRRTGLYVADRAIRKVGGWLRFSSRFGEGFSARIDVPLQSSLVPLLWVMAGGETYGIPAAQTHSVRASPEGIGLAIPHLASSLDAAPNRASTFTLDLQVGTDADVSHRFAVGVDAVESTETLLLRPLPPLVARLGPFAGAAVRGDGSLHLALDVEALALRLHTKGWQ